MERPFRAIDTGDLDDARALAKSLAGVAGGVKLGTTFVVKNGRGGVAEAGLQIWPDLKAAGNPQVTWPARCGRRARVSTHRSGAALQPGRRLDLCARPSRFAGAPRPRRPARRAGHPPRLVQD